MKVSCAAIAGLLLAAAVLGRVSAAEYPHKPVHIIVPFPAGGSADGFMRLLGQKLEVQLGQPIVVENKPGASGTTGSALVKQVAPDGYTLFFISDTSHGTGPWVIKDAGYDPVTDFAPIAQLISYQLVLAVNVSSPAQSLPELIKLSTTSPIVFGSWGVGGISHLVMETCARASGMRTVHVPYKGEAPMVTDLIGGQIQAMYSTVFVAQAHVATERLRALAVTGERSPPSMPHVPTMRSLQLPACQFVGWAGLGAPAGTPASVIDRLYQAVTAAMAAAEIQERVTKAGSEVAIKTPDEFRRTIVRDRKLFEEALRAAGISAQ